jgi:acyl-CoA thioesterase
MGDRIGLDWLGLLEEGDGWRLPVVPGLVSGAGALFGGCATAAAIAIAERAVTQPVVWVTAHFGALAKQGTAVDLSTRVISAGRTMTHLEVLGTVEGRNSFTARVTAGDRPAHDVQGQWASQPPVTDVADAERFDHPVHVDTWASRFEWRLAGSDADAGGPWAAWWVRSLAPIDPLVEAAVLCDYVTYGMGRALAQPMGGLSIDNVLRVHRPDAVRSAGWRLLEVRPEAIAGGFGSGTARLFADGTLIAAGSQSTVMNSWDWRLPTELTDASDANP